MRDFAWIRLYIALTKINYMTRNADVFLIGGTPAAHALSDAISKQGCFSNEMSWAIKIEEAGFNDPPRLVVLSVSDSLDKELIDRYKAVPLSDDDFYRTVELKDSKNIHLGNRNLSASLPISGAECRGSRRGD
jgi:phosphoribosyl 1,2-cyclic phosphodiesterase